MTTSMMRDNFARQSLAELYASARETRIYRDVRDGTFGENCQNIVEAFDGELLRRLAVGTITAAQERELRALSTPAPQPPATKAVEPARASAEPSIEHRTLLTLIEAASEALSALREARAAMLSEDAISASVIQRAADFASDRAVSRVTERTTGDVLLHYDEKTGRLVSMTSAMGETNFKYDKLNRLIALERPRLDA
jgi:hypothetical protein